MADRTYLTRAGLAKLQEDLAALQRRKRQLSNEVGRAAQLGDLRENAEYMAANEQLQHVITRITEAQWKLTRVTLTDDLPVKPGVVALGCCVTVRDVTTQREQAYTLVGPEEADPATGMLSMASPIGQALLGHAAPATVTVPLPAGPRTFEILSVTR